MFALCVKSSLRQGFCIVRVCVCVCFEAASRARGGGNICTQWHRPSAFTHGSCRATLHGLAGCDLPEAPGELFLLKASCASYFMPAKYSTVQLFTWEAWSTDLSLPPFYIFGEALCRFKRAWSTAPVIPLLSLPKQQSWPPNLRSKLQSRFLRNMYYYIERSSTCSFRFETGTRCRIVSYFPWAVHDLSLICEWVINSLYVLKKKKKNLSTLPMWWMWLCVWWRESAGTRNSVVLKRVR